jgi:hypothetical protein
MIINTDRDKEFASMYITLEQIRREKKKDRK